MCFVVGTVAVVGTYVACVLINVFAALDAFSFPFPSVKHIYVDIEAC